MNYFIHFEYPDYGHKWDIIVPITLQQYTLLVKDGPIIDIDGVNEDLLIDLFNDQLAINPIPNDNDIVLRCQGLSEPY